MSYAVNPLAVRLEEIRATIGSSDEQLAETLASHGARRFEEIDRNDEDLFDPDDLPPPSMNQCVRQLLAGGPYDTRAGFKYGYALESLCELRGESLSNRAWSAMHWDAVEAVDAALEAAGVSEATFRAGDHLLCRGAPVSIPRIDDFPSIGYLTVAEAKTALDALANIRFVETESDEMNPEEIEEALTEVKQWLQICVNTGRDLICFYA